MVASLLVMVCLQIFDSQNFRFQQDWFQQAEFWRIITAHWIHFNWQHLLLNGLGLVLCVAIALELSFVMFQSRNRTYYLQITLQTLCNV